MTYGTPSTKGSLILNIGCSLQEYGRAKELEERRLFLYGEITAIDDQDGMILDNVSMTGSLAEQILNVNREDNSLPLEERKPIWLYINSPGGDVTEGFALVSVIKLSKTPVYTINVGEWSSMAFLIGIAGKRRFSLPSSIFMMHEPSGLTLGKFSDMADKVEFNKRFNDLIIKKHVLECSRMTPGKYNGVSKKNFYMLPEDALRYGFIDEIVTDINTIL